MTEARGGGKSGRAMQVVARLHAAPPRHNAGAEWMAWSMFRALVERGHDVTVWLSRYGEDHEPYELDGVKVIPLESRLDFATAVRRASVLVSHLENVKPTAALARGYGKPFVAILQRYTKDARAKLEKQAAGKGEGMTDDLSISGLEVKKPKTGPDGWVKYMDPKAAKINQVTCPDGKIDTLEPVMPD